MSKSQPGFAVEAQAPFDMEGAVPVGQLEEGQAEFRLKVGPGGRVVIPAQLREVLGVAEGDTLLARLDGDEVRLMTVKTAIQRARAIVRGGIPAGVSLVDELIAERRREVEGERRKWGLKDD